MPAPDEGGGHIRKGFWPYPRGQDVAGREASNDGLRPHGHIRPHQVYKIYYALCLLLLDLGTLELPVADVDGYGQAPARGPMSARHGELALALRGRFVWRL